MFCKNENCGQVFTDIEKLKLHSYLHVRNMEPTKCFYQECNFVSAKYNSYKNHIHFHKFKNDPLPVYAPNNNPITNENSYVDLEYDIQEEPEAINEFDKLTDLYMNTFSKYKVIINHL